MGSWGVPTRKDIVAQQTTEAVSAGRHDIASSDKRRDEIGGGTRRICASEVVIASRLHLGLDAVSTAAVLRSRLLPSRPRDQEFVDLLGPTLRVAELLTAKERREGQTLRQVSGPILRFVGEDVVAHWSLATPRRRRSTQAHI